MTGNLVPTSSPQDTALDLLATFRDRAAALGVQVEHVATVTEAAAVIAALARQHNAPGLLVTAELRDAAPRLMAALADAGTPWLTASDPATTDGTPLGASLAHLAIADTASVLLAEPTLADRGVGLLATAWIALCPTAALVPDLAAAAPTLRDLAARPGPAYATLVTGPSRTADIELTLTVGVQGPAAVAVLFVDDLS